MLDKMKYTDVKYVVGEHKARLAVNAERFKSLRPLGERVYETEYGHKRVRLDVPIYLGKYL